MLRCVQKNWKTFSFRCVGRIFPSFQPQYVVFFLALLPGSCNGIVVELLLLLLSSYNLMVHTGTIYETPKVNPQRGASSAHGIRKFLEKKIVSSAPRQTSILTKYLVEFKIYYILL